LLKQVWSQASFAGLAASTVRECDAKPTASNKDTAKAATANSFLRMDSP
jgi:hypothetical protein